MHHRTTSQHFGRLSRRGLLKGGVGALTLTGVGSLPARLFFFYDM